MGLVEAERITVLPGAPTIYQSLLAAPGRADHDLSSLRFAVTGAAIVPVVLIERMRSRPPRTGHRQVVTAFGLTEAVVATMCRRRRPRRRPSPPPAGAPSRTSRRGSPAPASNAPSRRGGRGAAARAVRDARLPRRRGRPRPRPIDADGWLHTGDVGRLDDAGNLTITDRLKDMYICGGFNVYPAEVEQVLARLDGRRRRRRHRRARRAPRRGRQGVRRGLDGGGDGLDPRSRT